MSGKYTLAALILFLIFAPLIPAQTGTSHGILVTITPPNPIGGTGVIQGYQLFRCSVASCSVSSAAGWVAVNALIPAASQTANTTYLDPSSGLANNTTYQYVAETVDSNGNLSAYSPLLTQVVTVFPTNPNSPTCSSKVQ